MILNLIMAAFLVIYIAIGVFVAMSINRKVGIDCKSSLVPKLDKALADISSLIIGIATTTILFVITAGVANIINFIIEELN